MKKVLVIGASGQIGSDLVLELRKRFGADNIIASDIREPMREVLEGGPYVELNAMNKADIEKVVDDYKITEVYHLAAILSGNAEKNPAMAWDINMNSLFIILDVAKEKN